MLFNDRKEAGMKLAKALMHYKNKKDTLILGLPRGGVVTAYEVATILHIPLDVICPMKIGHPTNHEYAIGAITETGEGVFNESEISRLNIPQSYLKEAVAHATQEALARIRFFRENKPPLDISHKTVIVIDDGAATGLTLKASVAALRKIHASKVIIAIPVAPIDTVNALKKIADEVICLETPPFFYAVGQFYSHFGPVSTEEAKDLLQKVN